MSLLDALGIAASGLTAQRIRLETVSSNMANARTTRTPDGGPYRRKVPVFEAAPVAEAGFGGALQRELARVEVRDIVAAGGETQFVYDPTHPDANADGYVEYPDVNVLEEMVDLMTTARTYEANTNVISVTMQMADSALNIGR